MKKKVSTNVTEIVFVIYAFPSVTNFLMQKPLKITEKNIQCEKMTFEAKTVEICGRPVISLLI